MGDDKTTAAPDEDSSDEGGSPRVIQTRILVPPRRKDLLSRARLIDFIHEHTARRLILISAGAGYGKTSLLIDFAHDTPLPVCWYSIAESDDDPRTFLEYLVGCIAHRFPQVLEGNLHLLLSYTASGFDPQAVVGALINAVQEKILEAFFLVLDDYHYIGEASPVNSLLNTFLEQQPTNVTVILSSRTLPNISLIRLMARQEVAGLGSADLRFTAEEIQRLLSEKRSLSITLDQAQRLATESEGWITAIVLGMHTLWQGLLQIMIRARGQGEYVYDYLAQEVLIHQEAEVQEFLKKTSVLTSMDAGLCDQLLGRTDSSDMLDLLERRNLFVTRMPSTPVTYRYHDLFRKFLVDRLSAEEPSVFEQLHRRSGILYGDREAWNEALVHFVAAGDYEAAAQIVEERGWEMVASGRIGTLANWLDLLPEQLVEDHPSLLLLKGRLHVGRGETSKAEEVYSQLEGLARAECEWPQLAVILVEEAALLQEKGQYKESLSKCEEVMRLASSIRLDDRLLARVHKISGQCLGLTESISSAEEELNKALDIYERQGDLFYTANVLQDLGTVVRWKGDAERAEEVYLRALSLFEQLGNLGRAAEVLNNLAVGYHLEGSYEKALQTFREALVRAEDGMGLRAKGLILAGMGDLYRDLGQPDRAIELYSRALEIADGIGYGFLGLYSRAFLSEAYSLEWRFKEAREQMAIAEELASKQDTKYTLALVGTSEGIVAYRCNDLGLSTKYLISACGLLEEIGAKRELARARLHLAHSLYKAGRRSEAEGQLGLAIELSREAGHSQLLITDGRMMKPFLRKSLARHVGRRVARELLKHIEDFPSPQTLKAFEIEEAVPTVPCLEIRAFGHEHVLQDGKRVPQSAWGGPLVRELFFYILEQGPVTLNEIGLVLWPDYSSAKVKSIFHSTMYRLRCLIPPDFVIYDEGSDSYLFDRSQKYQYDVEEFEKASDLALGEELSNEGLIENCNRAIGIYTGEFLRDSSLSWCLAKQEKLRQKFINVLLRLATIYQQQGRLEESIVLYERVIEEDPFIERPHRSLMRCYVLRGERARAIKHYLDYSEYLLEELNMAPSVETMGLYDAILRGDFNEEDMQVIEA